MLRQVIAPFLLLGVAGAAPAPTLDWIGGHWCSELGDETVEELWLPPHGGVAVGLGRTRTAERTTAFEYLRIVDMLRANGVDCETGETWLPPALG